MATIIEHNTDPEKKPGFSAAEYNAIAIEAVLGAINLLSNRYEVNPECLGETSKWRLSYGKKVISCTHNKDESYVAAILRYEVTAKVGRKRAMTCIADYGIYYSVPEGAPEAAALGFCRNVGSFAAYPYFRSLVAQMTWNSGVSLPPLPAIASTAHIPKKTKVIEGEAVGG